MPPPDPRSSTVSPSRRSASAVGLPQPNEASSAVSGTWPASIESYRSAVIGSRVALAEPQHTTAPADGPQHPTDVSPSAILDATAPYRARTVPRSSSSSRVIGAAPCGLWSPCSSRQSKNVDESDEKKTV